MTDMETERAAGVRMMDQLKDFAQAPTTLRRIFLLLTRAHFSDPAHYGIQRERMRNFRWDKDESKSTVKIELDYVYDPAKTDSGPAIYVGMGDFSFKQSVMNNREGATADRSGQRFSLQGGCSLILRHVSQQAEESLVLAEMSFDFYVGIREYLMRRLSLSGFNPLQISTPRFFQADDAVKANKRYISDFVINISYTPAWTEFQESHRIRQITFGQALTDFAVTA